MRLLIYRLLFLIFFLLSSCFDGNRIRNWSNIQNNGVLRVLTTNTANTYFKGKDDQVEGFEYELSKNFAKQHNLKIEFTIKDSIDDIIQALKNGEGDIAAAGLTITDKRLNFFSFSPSYLDVKQAVVCGQDAQKIKSLNELEQMNFLIQENTSYEENLKRLKKEKLKKLSWIQVEGANSDILLQKVWKETNLCTIVDRHILSLHRRYMPELKEVYVFKQKEQIAWAINKENDKLLSVLTDWFNHRKTRTLIKDLKRKYFDFIDFDPYNLKTFIERIKTRLPKYKKLFQEAAKKYNIPWRLLAAVGYQESYWNPEAKSPTGVTGLMMITQRTARELGVKDRKDPKESIFGGAKYLRKLIDRLPEYLREKDRIWFALASYNVGYYHLRDALALAIWQNENPTKWHSVQRVLPLLSHKKHYKRLPYGHARGLEPVIYVKRIKDFYDILKKKEGPVAPIKVFN